MCGRFALRANRGDIRALRGNNANVDEWDGEDDFVPRYNIAPRTQAPVVRRRDPGPSSSSSSSSESASDAPLVMQTMKWGLVPHWSTVEDNTLNTINARAENLAEGGGLWGSIKGKKRCAVPCQGYYEWLTKGKDKLPHFLKRKDGGLLLMAGLYDCATIEGRTVWTFTIVTTDAAPAFSWLHDRQPVFLTSKEKLDAWLDTSKQTWTDELSRFVMQPYHDERVPLECYQVPKEVGKIGNESPSFIEPVANRKDGIQAMFAKQKQSQAQSQKQKQKPDLRPSVTNESTSSSTASPQKPAPAKDESTSTTESKTQDESDSSTTPTARSTPAASTGQRKRARSDSPSPPIVELGQQNERYTPNKKPKTDSREPPRTPAKSKGSSSSPKKGTPSSSSPSKSKKAASAAVGSAKITSFFKKSST